MLTLRQKEVVSLIAKGETYKSVAQALGICEETVNKHLDNLREVYEMPNTLSLVALLISQGEIGL